MKVLVTGSKGQLGWELMRTVPHGVDWIGLDLPDLDIRDLDAVEAVFTRHSPDLVINAAAFTNVDRAQSLEDQAFSVNHVGARNLAIAASRTAARLVQISTDFVFDGTQGRPYLPTDSPNPLNVYGLSKLAGERAVTEALGARALIVRTSWLYGIHGENFVKTMLRLFRERETVGVVVDQVGCPTSTASLASWLWKALASEFRGGVVHVSDSGVASWYDFAMAIREMALLLGVLNTDVEVHPIRTIDYPTPARRPSFSVMDQTEALSRGGSMPHWRASLNAMLLELRGRSNA